MVRAAEGNGECARSAWSTVERNVNHLREDDDGLGDVLQFASLWFRPRSRQISVECRQFYSEAIDFNGFLAFTLVTRVRIPYGTSVFRVAHERSGPRGYSRRLRAAIRYSATAAAPTDTVRDASSQSACVVHMAIQPRSIPAFPIMSCIPHPLRTRPGVGELWGRSDSLGIYSILA